MTAGNSTARPGGYEGRKDMALPDEYKFTLDDLQIIQEALSKYEHENREWLEKKQSELIEFMSVQDDPYVFPWVEDAIPDEDEDEGEPDDWASDYEKRLRALIERQQQYLLSIGQVSVKAAMQIHYVDD